MRVLADRILGQQGRRKRLGTNEQWMTVMTRQGEVGATRCVVDRSRKKREALDWARREQEFAGSCHQYQSRSMAKRRSFVSAMLFINNHEEGLKQNRRVRQKIRVLDKCQSRQGCNKLLFQSNGSSIKPRLVSVLISARKEP